MNAVYTAMKMIRPRHLGVFFLVIAASFVFLLLMPSAHTHALTVTVPGQDWNGRAQFHGYFTNENTSCNANNTCGANEPFCNFNPGQCENEDGGNFVLPVYLKCGTQFEAIPPSCIANAGSDEARVADLITLLKSETDSGINRREIGASFIYNTLLGRTGDQAQRNITDADWTNLQTLIDDELTDGQITINWNETVESWYRTYMVEIGDQNTADVTYYCSDPGCGAADPPNTPQDDAAIVFTNAATGNPVYVLYRECANPGGHMEGLPALSAPAASGDYAASSTATPAQIGVGGTATFKDFITVSHFTKAANVGWVVQRTVNGAASGAPIDGTLNANKNGTFTVETDTYTDTADPPGTVVCDDLSINNPPPDNQVNPRDSNACVTVLAQPYLTVTGNDVWAGSNFDYAGATNPCAPAENSTIKTWDSQAGFGSYAQYGVMALGAITGLGSAGAPGNGGNNTLTFANTPNNGNLGDSPRCIPDYYTAVGTTGPTPPGYPNNINVANLSSQLYYAPGNITITGGQVNGGVHAAIVTNGTITITGDVTYPATYTSLQDIPSLWVISNSSINIQENVDTVTGFYVAEGKSGGAAPNGVIQTCVETGKTTTYNPLHIGVCGTQLTVNGALLARQVYWQRTGGTDAVGQPSAEQIQFSPELYLESPLMATPPPGGLSTTGFTQLPPVY